MAITVDRKKRALLVMDLQNYMIEHGRRNHEKTHDTEDNVLEQEGQ